MPVAPKVPRPRTVLDIGPSLACLPTARHGAALVHFLHAREGGVVEKRRNMEYPSWPCEHPFDLDWRSLTDVASYSTVPYSFVPNPLVVPRDSTLHKGNGKNVEHISI
jgi:hypothetical protein